jgi:hypothetical protein
MILTDGFIVRLLHPSDTARYIVEGALAVVLMVGGKILCDRREDCPPVLLGRPSAYAASRGVPGMMRGINSIRFSEAISLTISNRCPPSARVWRKPEFRNRAAPAA